MNLRKLRQTKTIHFEDEGRVQSREITYYHPIARHFAQGLYRLGMTLTKISVKTGIDRSTLNEWADHWPEQVPRYWQNMTCADCCYLVRETDGASCAHGKFDNMPETALAARLMYACGIWRI